MEGFAAIVPEGGSFLMRCAACGEELFVENPKAGISGVNFLHENDCPFLAAMEAGESNEYIEKNGYPMIYAREKPQTGSNGK